MRIPLVLLSFVLLSDCLCPAFAQSATRARTILIRNVSRANDPIRVKLMDGATELKSDGRSSPNDSFWKTGFEANDDWITHLSFAIQNVSGKKITCIIIFSVFPETPFWQGDKQPVSAKVLGFAQNRVGRRPEHALHSGDRTFHPDNGAPFELAPGEEFTMLIEDPNRRVPIPNVTALDTGTITVFFDDRSKWVSVNHRNSRPAVEPGKWTKNSFE
jgi:hypothetical protein